MKKFILLFVFFFSGIAFGQVQNGVKHIKEDVTLNKIEKTAEFPKGFSEFRNMIYNNFRIENIQGNEKIHSDITFIVERDGTIVDIKASGSNESFNKEAVYAISKIKEKWIPATIDGVPVRYKFRVPLDITFEEVGDPAKFPQGNDVFKKMIVDNFRKEKFQGKGVKKCIISFGVLQNGEISNVQTKGKNKSFNKEVVRAVSKIKEKWIPKFAMGSPVASGIEIQFEMNFE